jgi:hypothetical protein
MAISLGPGMGNVPRLDPTMGSKQQADGGLVAAIRNATDIAGKIATKAVGAVAAGTAAAMGPLAPELQRIEYLLWKRLLYEHTMWLDHQTSIGIDAATQDMNRRMAWLKSQAPQIRQALITIFTTAGLDAAVQYRKALRKQIPDAFFWAAEM